MSFKRAPLAAMSPRRLAELEESGRLVPNSTFARPEPGTAQPQKPTTYTGPDLKTKQLVRARSGGRCEFPGCRSRATDVHHRFERGVGGTSKPWINDVANLLHSCRHHNDWSSNQQPLEAELMGWRLRHFDLPTEVPVQTRHDPLPVWLDNQGGWWPFDEGIP